MRWKHYDLSNGAFHTAKAKIFITGGAEMLVSIAVMAVIGAGIGWYTNRIAIRMLFRPQKPVKIPMTGIRLQGLIPRRRADIAASIGQVVDKELLSIEEIVAKLAADKNRTGIITTIKSKAGEIIRQKLPGIIPSYIKDLVVGYVDDIIDQQADIVINELVENTIHQAAIEMNIGRMVEDKINRFDLDKLEQIVVSVAGRELRHIEYLGAVIGFLIGIGQGLIMQLITSI
jgi:uncharacterized membrane protein YheB (UPF0754 family)